MKPETIYKKALMLLTCQIIAFEHQLDLVMKEPESYQRGQRIASLANQLQYANQSAMHFTLNYSFEKINKLYSLPDKPDEEKP